MNEDPTETVDQWRRRLYPANCLRCARRMDLNAVSHGCERWQCAPCDAYFVRGVPKYGAPDPEMRAGKDFDAYASGRDVVHRCQDCSAVLDVQSDNLGPLIGSAVAAHRKVCPQRPPGPGDYVEWRSTRIPGNWVRGELLRLDDLAEIRIESHGPYREQGAMRMGVDVFGYKNGISSTLRRIPRPAEAQATVPRNRDVCPLDDEALYRCMTCVETMTGWSVNQRRWNPGKCGCGGELEMPEARERRLAKEKAIARPKEGDRIPLAPTAPALVDGLTRRECLIRWSRNRAGQETLRSEDAGIEFGTFEPMTPDQIAAAKQEHARATAWKSEELRAMVEASAKRDRDRVRVDLEFEPHE